jgi:hypothetical protein
VSSSVTAAVAAAAGSDAVRGRSPDTDDVRVGAYAQGAVELASLGQRGEPLELSLAAPFGALFSALFHGRSPAVRSFSLTYVSLEQLGGSLTFSAKLSELREGGEAKLTLLVFEGARVCVRGEAIVALGQGSRESNS